jgi:arylesterase/paraoxonase
MEGRIYYYDYGKSSFKDEGSVHELPVSGLYSSKTQPNTLHPLGMGLHRESRTLFVINLGKGGPAIEVVKLDAKGTSGVHKETLKHPLIATPNSVWPLSEDEILFTNDHRWTGRTNPVLSKLENLALIPGGSVVHYNLKTKEAKKLWNIPFANGVAALNKTHIAVASTTMPAVLIFELDRAATALTLKLTLRPTFWADNLSVDAAGKLLLAGHPHPFLLQRAAEGSQFYDVDETGEAGLRPGGERPRSPSWVVEWDGNPEGKLTNLFVGHEFGSSTSAVRDLKRGVGFVSGLYEKGIMMWKE